MTNSTFSEITTIFTMADIADESMDLLSITAIDMRVECDLALKAGNETEIFYASWNYALDTESTQFIFFPNHGRGGICCGGLTEWSDCKDLDDLEDRWFSRNTECDTWC